MRFNSAVAAFLLSCLATGVGVAGSLSAQARQLENRGDARGARALLERAAQGSSASVDALMDYADFLGRHNDPAAMAVYAKAAQAAEKAGDQQRRQACWHRAAALALLAGDRDAAGRMLEGYRAAGGSGLALPARRNRESRSTIAIPGPMRSFSRMAALSPDLGPQDVLPALSRNVVTNGYQAGGGSEGLDQTEYLKLVIRYLSQARELEAMSGKDHFLRIETCESSQTADLLKILGYRMRGGCGSEVVLETVNASRAFLTIDSGFPLADLEAALRTSRPFAYDYSPTLVPVLYGADYWLAAREGKGTSEFLDYFLSDPSICRLYTAMSKLDHETADALRKNASVTRLKAFSHILDFYGGMFQIHDGKAMIPGGAPNADAWKEIVGASPDSGAQFYDKLLARDDGWLASYYDALARIDGPVRDSLCQPARLKRFYAAIRGKVTSPGPARPVFRANTDMMLLTTRLRLDADGRPHVPGGMEVWRDLFIRHPHGKYDGKLTRAATNWKDPDDLVEALFALCRKAVENEPLKIYMAMSEIDRGRAKPLSPETVDRLARSFRTQGAQYTIFVETPALSDASIAAYMDAIDSINKIRDQGFRSDVAGMLQALAGLWQIVVREGALAEPAADATFAAIVKPFADMRTANDLFDAGRGGVRELLTATRSPADMTAQDRMVDLVAGATSFTDEEAHTQVITEMIRIFEAQRLISLNHLFDLADHLDAVAKGSKLDPAIVKRVSTRIAEIQPPRSALSSAERTSMVFGYWTDKHIDTERKLNLRALSERNAESGEKLRDIRGHLAPLLRDTLVGFNYIHYAPPGAQILQTNPLFVRSHDFVGAQGAGQMWKHTEVYGSGWPSSAGGRLVGSLCGLPYALAEAEQNFLIPTREQALIWGDLVPQMILMAKIPRWWKVTPAETHWVALHMRYAEYALADAALDAGKRPALLASLGRYAPPARVERVSDLLSEGEVHDVLEQVTPSEMFATAAALLASGSPEPGSLGDDIRAEAQANPGLTYAAVSRAFGTPKPTLAHSYRPELLNLRTFPTLMGYSSRIMAESWESSLLFYAALSDEVHLTPAQLNVAVPEWTRATVERIFATHLEDWPALLRSLRLVGDDVRTHLRKGGVAAAGAGGGGF
jgi:hypothetical protein